MSAHQCPKCALLFTWTTELDDHLRSEHPDFRHSYPVSRHDGPPHPADPSATLHPGDQTLPAR